MPVIPAHSPKNTGHFAGHLEKKYRTFYRTSEANFATLVRNYCISAVFYKWCWGSVTVGQYLTVIISPAAYFCSHYAKY